MQISQIYASAALNLHLSVLIESWKSLENDTVPFRRNVDGNDDLVQALEMEGGREARAEDLGWWEMIEAIKRIGEFAVEGNLTPETFLDNICQKLPETNPNKKDKDKPLKQHVVILNP